MFGMLDYRAHKLYLILFGIPIIIINLISIFGIGFIAYLVGFSFVETWLIKIILSVVVLFIVEGLWAILILGVVKLFDFIFGLFVDIIPSGKRTKEEAKVVVYNGEKGITALLLNNHPKEWTDENIVELAKLDWVANLFYYYKIHNRLVRIKEHYEENPETIFHEWTLKEFLKNKNLSMSWHEQVFSNRFLRKMALSYFVFVLIILINPLAI